MMTQKPLNLPELRAAFAAGDDTPTALCERLLERHQSHEGLHAFTHLQGDEVLAQAKASTARWQSGSALGPLDGIPVAIKDNLTTLDMPTTCASKMLKDYHAPYDATCVQRLRAAGAILFGKTNMDEFAMGSSSEHSAHAPVHNPWHPERAPGGSSGGSAAAVAADLVPLALGSDTGGSIRQPAAFCGMAGLKPTYGRVSRYGLAAFASSLDQVGPMARSVADAAALYDVIAGHDPKDSTSATQAHSPWQAPSDAAAVVSGKTLGVPKEYFVKGLNAQVETAVRAAISHYERMGANVVEVSLPHTAYAIPTYYVLCTAEASANLSRFDGVRFGYRAKEAKDIHSLYEKSRMGGFGAEVQRRIVLGTYVLSSGYYDAYYDKAQRVRRLVRDDFLKVFDGQGVDAIITPTTPTTAFALGDFDQDPTAMYLADIFTVGANLAGLPALSLPCGFDDAGLPIGVQLIGGHFDEAQLFELGHAYQTQTQWHTKVAPQ